MTAQPLRLAHLPGRVAAEIRDHPVFAFWLVVAVGVRIAFWAVTDRTWEDALITVAHARNAAEGSGLTHHPGEGLVHGFTSPLSVLIPLMGELISSGSGLLVLRLASLAAAGATIGFGYAISRRLGLRGLALSFVLGYLALDQNQIFYGMAGMETQVAVAILLGAVYFAMRHHAAGIAVTSGLAMLARPEFGLWIAALTLAAVFHRQLRTIAAVAVGLLIFSGPWFLFATIYYGSPIPHTILAKATVWSALPEEFAGFELLSWAGDRAILVVAATIKTFTPFFEDDLVVSAPLPLGLVVIVGCVMLLLAAVGAWQVRRTLLPATVFIALFLVYRAVFLPIGYFEWYLPPFTAVCALFIAVAISRLDGRLGAIKPALAVGLLVAVAVHLPFSVPLNAKVQTEIEYGVRREVGLFLRGQVPEGEAFVAESAGYFGYYSRSTMWDFPGLTSPTALSMVQALPSEDRWVWGLLAESHASWAVLRPIEWEEFKRSFPEASACYEPIRTFGSYRDTIALSGLEKITYDSEFTVYHQEGCG